jgi:hypothetical protein
VFPAGRIRQGGCAVDVWLLCRRVDNRWTINDAQHRGGKVVPLRPKTIDDGEIRPGPLRVEPLTAAQEAEAVELLTALFATALQRQRSMSLRRAA